MSSLKYLFAIAVMACLASSAFAVHCYVCESTQNPKCGEHFMADDSMKVDCSRIEAPLFTQALMIGRNTNATGCMKKTLQKAVGQAYTLRTCFHGDIANIKIGCDMDPQNLFVKQLSCDVCSGNLCNSSTSMAPVAFAIVAFFALARIFS